MSSTKKNVALLGLSICKKGENMEDNNELKDLVLDDKDDGSNSRKMRKLLIIIAALVILFLIILFVMKMLNSSTTNNQNEGRVVVPPEIETVQKNEPNDTIFEQVPILKDENESQKQSFEDIVKNLKEKEELRQTSKNTETLPSAPQTTPKEQTNKTIESKKDQSPVKSEENKEPKSEAKSDNKKDLTTNSKTESKKNTKPIKQSVSINNKTTADTKKSTPSTTTSSTKASASNSNAGAGTYVQVASLSKVDTNNELFKKLKNSGYDYRVYETTINGSKINKILVGPYDGSKADTTLKDIRSKVNPNAFIFKVK